jgi:hypothetical protein
VPVQNNLETAAMHPLVQTIVVIGVAVSAIALTFSLMELRHIRSILQSGKTAGAWQPTSAGSAQLAPGMFSSKAGFAIYAFRQGKWVLEADYSKPGYEAVGPTIAGAYENQVVKKESALKGKG